MTGMVRFLLSRSCGLCTNLGGGWDIVVRGESRRPPPGCRHRPGDAEQVGSPVDGVPDQRGDIDVPQALEQDDPGAQRPRRGGQVETDDPAATGRGFITMNGCPAETGVLVGSHGSAVCRSGCRAAAPPSSSYSSDTNATATTPARKKITTTSATASTASRTRPGSRTAGPRCTRGRPGPSRRR